MTSTIIPCLRYRDAPQMIEWLCKAFGFERHLVVEDGKGGIAHAPLTLGPGMIMLGTARGDDDPFSRLQSTPAALGGTTQSPYLVVRDADQVYRQAKTPGAGIVPRTKGEKKTGGAFSCPD